MRLSFALQNSKNKGLTVELVRVSLFILILGVSVISALVQGSFVNCGVLGPFYGILTVALGLHIY